MARDQIRTLEFSDRAAWRSWLRRNHDDHPGAWLVFRKGPSAHRGMTYEDAFQEALCFGWIDSVIRNVDERRYVRKFTPRTSMGNWSAANLERVELLIKTGRMTAAGLSKVQRGVKPAVPLAAKRWVMPAFFKEGLRKNAAARRYFDELAPSYQRAYIAWLATAKRPNTRVRRLNEALTLLAAGKKLGPR